MATVDSEDADPARVRAQKIADQVFVFACAECEKYVDVQVQVEFWRYLQQCIVAVLPAGTLISPGADTARVLVGRGDTGDGIE